MSYLDLRLVQHEKPPTRKQINALQHWLLIFPLSGTKSRLPYVEKLMTRRKQLGMKRADSEPLELDLANPRSSHVVYACIDDKISSFDLVTLARKMIGAQKKYRATRLGIIVDGFDSSSAERITEAVIAAAGAAAAEMPNFKSERGPEKMLRRLDLYGMKAAHGFRRTLAEAEGNAMARYLSMLPENELTPGNYLSRISGLADERGWKLEFYDTRALQRKKAGAFLAVVQASEEKDAGIARLRYRAPSPRGARTVGLVGNGICYDTGGTNLKPAKYMYGMHEDMQGSAVALGTFFALSKLAVDFNMECWLALATNHIGPKAYKPNDVIRAYDGTTIEIVHTDAEGRMVLADTLAMVSGTKPNIIIDFATLTGACVYSLGSAYSGAFTNREQLQPALIQAGRESGERVWPFPLDEDYDRGLESEIADIKQCATEGGADHILAARFLQRFVKNDTPWVHVDLAASNRKGGLGHVPTDTTGFGVRFALHLLLDRELPD